MIRILRILNTNATEDSYMYMSQIIVIFGYHTGNNYRGRGDNIK